MAEIQKYAEKKRIFFNPKISWIRCGCHSLNLAVVCKKYCNLDFLSEIETIISKAQEIVTKIRGSRKLSDLLVEKIAAFHPDTKIRKLIASNITRWGSTFLMLSRILYLKKEIKEILKDSNLVKKYDISIPTKDDWTLFQVIYVFLLEFFKNNMYIEAGAKPTLHLITTTYISLYTHCMYTIEQLDGEPLYNDIICGIIKAANILTKYFNLGSIIHFASSAFDPRGKLYIYENKGWMDAANEMTEE